MTPLLMTFSPVLDRTAGAYFGAALEEVDVDLVPYLEDYSDEDLAQLDAAIATAREHPAGGAIEGEHPAELLELLLRRQILLRAAGGDES